MFNYKSKTVTKELANGTSTTEEEKSEVISFSAIEFDPITLSEFTDLIDEPTLEYLNLNYPGYTSGSIKADRYKEDFTINYNPVEEEQLTIHVNKYTLYFDRITKLYKSNNFTTVYTLTESWIINKYDGEFAYEARDCQFAGEGVSLNAQFNYGYLSASKVFPNTPDNIEIRRNISSGNPKIKYEQQTVDYADNVDDNPASEVIEYKYSYRPDPEDIVKRTTVYNY